MSARPIFTIGHSSQSLDAFVALVKRHAVDVVADTRSYPYSTFASQFDQPSLRDRLRAEGVHYLYLGRELGGRPSGTEFYDGDGHVLYWKVAASPVFRDGIERLKIGAAQYNVAILCSEENPFVCHRHLLIGRVLEEAGYEVAHIRGDGRIEGSEAGEPQGWLFPPLTAP